MIGMKPFWKQRKFQVLVTGIVTIVLTDYLHMEAELVGMIASLFGILIASIAYEDGKIKKV
jgi:hypothetical protein